MPVADTLSGMAGVYYPGYRFPANRRELAEPPKAPSPPHPSMSPVQRRSTNAVAKPSYEHNVSPINRTPIPRHAESRSELGARWLEGDGRSGVNARATWWPSWYAVS